MEAIVLAGGVGSRLKSVVSHLPKPMADIGGKPFLEYLLKYLDREGVERVVLSVGYKGDLIQNHFGNSFQNLPLVYSVEEEPLGTGGAILASLKKTESPNLLILNGDTFFSISLQALEEFRISQDSPLGIALKNMRDFDRYGTVRLDGESRVLGFEEKKKKEEGLINGGIYSLDRNWLEGLSLPEKFSWEKEVLEKHCAKTSFVGKPFDDYFIDIGIPEDYERAQEDFKKFEGR